MRKYYEVLLYSKARWIGEGFIFTTQRSQPALSFSLFYMFNSQLLTDTISSENLNILFTLILFHFSCRAIHSDYLSPNSLEGKLVVNLFDESNVEIKRLNNEKCSNWLGSLDIPLSVFSCSDGVSFFLL